MSDRRERIPADEVKEPKRWNLPFWTEPSHVVHSETPEEDEEVSVEEEEIEVEPLTAEQLEAIRQEAYNEGLEQGLIEGRQKGEKLGYDEGFQEGKTEGEAEGKKLGFDAGFEQGEKQAFSNTTKEQQQISQRYEQVLAAIQADIAEQKETLNQNIPDIILALAKAVITEELSQGSEHIVKLVREAVDALPLDSGEMKIEVNPQDLPFVEAALEQGEFEGNVVAKDSIKAGGCRVSSRYSSVDFTLSERWQAIEKQYHHQLQLSQNEELEEDDKPLESLSSEDATQTDGLDDSQQPSSHDDETIVNHEDELSPQDPQHNPTDEDDHEPQDP